MTPKASRLLWMLFLGLLLITAPAGCGRQRRESSQEPAAPAAATIAETPTAAPAETPAETPTVAAVEAAAESPLAAPDSPLAAPDSPLTLPNTSPLATPVAQMETAPGTGAVTGVLLVRTEQGEAPVPNMIVALGAVLTNDNGQPAAVRYNAQESPQTNTDESGFFAIPDVPPGDYSLILDLVITSYILRKPGSEEDLFITVEADRQVDLGQLVYDNLPLPETPE